MYKLREQRLREMVQNDEESLGTLNVTEDGGITECTETTISMGQEADSVRRSSNIQVPSASSDLRVCKDWPFQASSYDSSVLWGCRVYFLTLVCISLVCFFFLW